MKKHAYHIVQVIILLSVVFPCHSQERNLLSGEYTPDEIRASLLEAKEWNPFPEYTDRESWQQVDKKVSIHYIKEAERLLDFSWPALTASVFLEFIITGNRSNYQTTYHERRDVLTTLVLAEVLEGEGRFTLKITDGIWAICEESYWGVPAHLYLQKSGRGLPDIAEPTVDLFAAETGALLAWIVYLLEDELDRISPLIADRVRIEADRRILKPCLERSDFWWQGLIPLGETNVKIERLNNWTPWILSNWLTTALLLETDEARRTGAVEKTMLCMDQYLNPHPADGGCDEGPSYWNHAGGRVFHFLELLNSVTAGNINIGHEPLIRNMGKYIYRAHIAGDYYINFADASARVTVDPGLIYRYGRYINDSHLIDFGAYTASLQDYGNPELYGKLGPLLFALFSLNEMKHLDPVAPAPAEVWLPDIQVMATRSDMAPGNSLYLAAKGGHNHESHNHNDVGHFIVYKNGKPALIDVGVETYTAKTFDPETRYDIWTMQSAFHNLPTINGFIQEEGLQYKATDVSYVSGKQKTSISMDLAGAYPEKAAINYYRRTITLHHGEHVEIKDAYSLKEHQAELVLNLLSPLDVKLFSEGRIELISKSDETQVLSIEFTSRKFDVEVEEIPVTDPKLSRSWPDGLNRILFTSRDRKKRDVYSMTIK
jgi:hypothetical protein